MNYKKLLKILAAVIALLLIGLLLSAVNSFVGNPISSAIATSKIRTYVKETYPDLDLEVPKATYNFKYNAYSSFVQSRTSEDTCFSVSWRNGNISDRYESDVVSRFTTFRRLSSEFSSAVEPIINNEFPYETSILIADFSKSDDEFSNLNLDMSLDINNPPLPAYLTIYMLHQDVNYEFFRDRILEVYQIMEQHNIPIEVYSFVLQEPLPEGEKAAPDGKSIYLFDFPAEKIMEENLIENMILHQQQLEDESDKEKRSEIAK